MSRSRSRILLVAAALTAAVILVALAWSAARFMDPERFAATLAEGMEARFGMKVSAATASASFSRGPVVTLRDVAVGSPESTPRLAVDALEARLSLFPLLLGRFTVTRMTLKNPTAVVGAVALPLSPSGNMNDLPFLDIRGGTLIIDHDAGGIVLDHIEGTFDASAVHGTALLMGQHIAVDLAVKEASLKGIVELPGVDLERVHSSLRGRSDVRIAVDAAPRSANINCTLDIQEFKLPWWTEEMAAEASFVLRADEERVTLSDLEFRGPAIQLYGRADLAGYRYGEKNGAARVTLSARTSELDYEGVIDLLPLHLFPDWLDLLLARQIRDGAVTVTALEYEGTLAELLSAEQFLGGLYIETALRDLSFGAGYDDSRVHHINGRGALSGVTLSFYDLSARAGSSRVDEVELVFHDITEKKDTEVSVFARVDMELPDFVTAWRASMTLQSVHGLLGPVSEVRGGRIEGSVRTWSHPERSGSVRMRGQVIVEDGVFRWNNHSIESLKGRALKETFEDSLTIVAEGVADGYAVDHLEVSMPDPFEEETYGLSFSLTRLPELEEMIHFSESLRFAFTGTGAGNELRGTMLITSPEITMHGREYGPAEGRIDGSVIIGHDFITSEGLSILYGDVAGRVSGSIARSDPRRFSGSIVLDNLVLKDPGSEGLSLLRNYAGSAHILLRNILFRGIPIETVEARADLEEGVLRLEDFECRLSSGQIRGMLILEPSATPRFDLDMDVQGKNLEQLIEAFWPSQSPMDGLFAVRGTLRGSVDALNGDIAIEATQGRLQRYAVMSKILTATNLYRLFAAEPTGFFEQGLRFDRLAVTLEIRDGTAVFEDFLMESPSIQASAVGEYDVTEKTIDAVVVIQPLETIDRIIGLVPLVNWILLGQERRLVVVSVKVQGPIEDPSIRLAPLDSISRPVTGILLRTLRLPLDIILKPEVMVPGGSPQTPGEHEP